MTTENQLYEVIGEEEREISSFTPHPYNSTYVGAENMRADPQLIADIAENGLLRKPGVLDVEGMTFILYGHRRIDALTQLGITKCVVEIVRPRPGVSVEDIIQADNNNRPKNERMKNAEACRFIARIESSAKLRKVKHLKGMADAISADDTPDIEDTGRTADVAANQLGESARTIKSRKLVHYEPVMDNFLNWLSIPQHKSCDIKKAIDLVAECRTRWLEIREANNSEEISISAAASMIRTLQQEMEHRALGKKEKKTKPTASTIKRQAKEEKEPRVEADEVTLTFASRPSGLVWITNNEGVRFGLAQHEGAFVPAYEGADGQIVVVPWGNILTNQS